MFERRSHPSGEALFLVTDEALYAANTGRPFDKRGVVSVCNENLSSKSPRGPQNRALADAALVEAITKERLEVYRIQPDQLEQDANHELETRCDYEGRCLWELLQNMDDALAPAGSPPAELIGSKGLGFKSVLEVTDAPEVHSEPFHFGFDAARSRGQLKAIVSDPPHLVFRLPHPVRPDKTVLKLLSDRYVTVIKLPFRDSAAREGIIQRLGRLSPHFLILSQHLGSVEIRLPGGRRRLTHKGARAAHACGEKAVLTISGRGAPRTEEWKVWGGRWNPANADGKRLSAAIALPWGQDGAEAAPKDIPLHVFYPTQEDIAAPFLVHAAFSLRGDRNHLRDGPHDAFLLEKISELTSSILQDIPPASAIAVFASLVQASGGGAKRKLHRRISQAIARRVTNTAFVPAVGGDRVRPGEIRLWDHGLGNLLEPRLKAVKEMQLASPSLGHVQDQLSAVFKAKALSAGESARALQSVRCDTLQRAIQVAKIAAAACFRGSYLDAGVAASLRAASFWFTAKGEGRPLMGDRTFLMARPDRWPNWLLADELDPAFQAAVFDPKDPKQDLWVSLTKGYLLAEPKEWIVKALAPALDGWAQEDWTKWGWECLEALDRWADIPDFEKALPFLPLKDPDPVRLALIGKVRAPCGKAWEPACDAYASGELNANDVFARHARQAGLPVVGKPAKVPFSTPRWRALLRYIGVSWEPKVRLWTDQTAGLGNERLCLCLLPGEPAAPGAGLVSRRVSGVRGRRQRCRSNKDA